MNLKRYNQEEFRLHCTRFFDFRAHLDPTELAYLYYCFGDNKDATDPSDISSKTYSHKITSEGINSSRIGYGFATLTREHRTQIEIILKHKLPQEDFGTYLDSCTGAGIAWDIIQNHFKVYFYYTNNTASCIPPFIEKQFGSLSSERIISYTYQQGKKIEEKYYYYPKKSTWEELVRTHSTQKIDPILCAYAKRLAFVLSDTKKPRFQWDIKQEHANSIIKELDLQTQKLHTLCTSLRQELDTIAADNSSIQLYYT